MILKPKALVSKLRLRSKLQKYLLLLEILYKLTISDNIIVIGTKSKELEILTLEKTILMTKAKSKIYKLKL